MQSTTLTHAKLRLSESNVRKANGDAGLEALAASIAEHGLLQPLIVSSSAGRKTLRCPRRWPPLARDRPADRTRRAAQGLRDRCAPLRERGCRRARNQPCGKPDPRSHDASGRSARLSRHRRWRRRCRSRGAPLWRDGPPCAGPPSPCRSGRTDLRRAGAGEITLDVAQAYGSTGDRERQAAAWERLSTSWQADNPQAIRRAIAEESLSADHPIARFLGEAEYVACGGRIERDLFAAEGEGRWLDGDLAMDLAAKKLAHEAEVAELGSKLAWVKPTLATHVTYDETKDLHAYWPRRAEPSAEALARMDEISDRMTEISEILDAPDDGDDVEALEAEYNALDAEHDRLSDTDLLIPDEDKPNVGTFLVLGKDGQPRLLETYYTAAKPARRPSASGKPQ
jgi:ParB family chromosome partitioning protein